MVLLVLDKHAKPKKGPLMSLDLARNSAVFRRFFSEDRRALFEQVRDVSQRVLAPDTCRLHTGNATLEEKLPELAQFRGVGIPAEFGGIAEFQGIVDMVILHENLAYGSASASAFFDGNGLFATPIMLAGTEVQKRKYLTDLVAGKIVGCYGLTDLQCGSDVANMSTLRFAKQGEVYVLNGSKTFVTNAPIAHFTVVFAVERGNEERYRNITVFIVPAKNACADGFVAEKPMDKLGWRASHTSIISLDDVSATAEDIVGKIGDGFLIAVTTLAYGRLKIAAEALGLMERALDEVIKFVRERRGVGGPLHLQPVAQYQIDEIAQLVQATRDTIYSTAFLAETLDSDGKVTNFATEAAQAKSFAGRALQRVVNLALPLHGGSGFTFEYPISVIYVDAPLYMIGEGADNVLAISTGASIVGK
ncbi:acyl-CoA dehydrogenase family protein [Candidatus Micrarchaeota archaeon]|nr:acyl-CoA dehydrogenase family protein [Candidatus Micrarchaeota archaeon]